MKEYKLSGWPELPAAYQRTAYQRMLHQMSQGYVPLAELVRNSGLGREAVRQFLAQLHSRGVLEERAPDVPPSPPLRAGQTWNWLRRTLGAAVMRRS